MIYYDLQNNILELCPHFFRIKHTINSSIRLPLKNYKKDDYKSKNR